MKLIIFAGGIGTRLWPLSRENSPKQFDKIFGGKSTLELAVARVEKDFGAENIYIQTVENYVPVVREQVPQVPLENIIIEPARRNLGPAVCLAMIELAKRGYDGPIALLWADHLMKNHDEFIRALKTGEKLILENPNRFVFLGEKPRFANNNLGWIKVGNHIDTIGEVDYHSFSGWKYKPSVTECRDMFEAGDCYWNPGYFITSVGFLLDQYQQLAPQIYADVVNGNYENAEATHFDRAIIEKVDLSQAVVLKTDMSWSDPGTLYALKEALELSNEDNVCAGKVSVLDTRDSLIYNLEEKKLVTAIGLDGMVIVNTPDALVVVPRDEVVKITDLVKQLREEAHHDYL